MTNRDDIDQLQIGPDPDKLLVYHHQQLSAMLDGELSPDEAKFMLRRLQHDSQLAACWERWQVCGDMLRGRHHALLPRDFADRVSRAIAGDSDAGPVPQASPRPPRLLRWGGGAALAASVALVAVFATRQLPDPVPEPAAPAQPLVAAVELDLPAQASVDAQAPADVPAAPGAVVADAAPVVLAAAVAATEVPRRRNADRRARSAMQQRSAVARTASAPAETALATVEPPLAVAGRDAVAAFPPPPALQPRPWPRAILPGTGGTAFAVGHGQLSMLAPQATGFDPFRPRLVEMPADGAVREPAPRGGDDSTP